MEEPTNPQTTPSSNGMQPAAVPAPMQPAMPAPVQPAVPAQPEHTMTTPSMAPQQVAPAVPAPATTPETVAAAAPTPISQMPVVPDVPMVPTPAPVEAAPPQPNVAGTSDVLQPVATPPPAMAQETPAAPQQMMQSESPMHVNAQEMAGGHKGGKGKLLWVVFGVIILMLIGVLGFLMFKGSANKPQPSPSPAASTAPSPSASPKAAEDDLTLTAGDDDASLEKDVAKLQRELDGITTNQADLADDQSAQDNPEKL